MNCVHVPQFSVLLTLKIIGLEFLFPFGITSTCTHHISVSKICSDSCYWFSHYNFDVHTLLLVVPWKLFYAWLVSLMYLPYNSMLAIFFSIHNIYASLESYVIKMWITLICSHFICNYSWCFCLFFRVNGWFWLLCQVCEISISHRFSCIHMYKVPYQRIKVSDVYVCVCVFSYIFHLVPITLLKWNETTKKLHLILYKSNDI